MLYRNIWNGKLWDTEVVGQGPKTSDWQAINFNGPQEVYLTLDAWLRSEKSHLAAHDFSESGYCYLNADGYDYSDHLSRPVSIEEAWNQGWIWIDSDGIKTCCGHQIPTLPIAFNFPKIRRRIEDRLRKLEDTNTLLRIASELGVKIS